ncbi:MAG: hypothetical protein ACRBEE_15710 [Arenicella sp.]
MDGGAIKLIDLYINQELRKATKVEHIALDLNISPQTLKKFRDDPYQLSDYKVNQMRNKVESLNKDTNTSVNINTYQAGGYSQSIVEPYIGSYWLFRYSFSESASIVKMFLEISWDEEKQMAIFIEDHRKDKSIVDSTDSSIQGYLSFPKAIANVMHLVTQQEGAVRVFTLHRQIDLKNNLLRGVLLSQADVSGNNHFIPAISPVILIKNDQQLSEAPGKKLIYDSNDSSMDMIKEELINTEKRFCFFSTSIQ